ncbi:hypothetical protein GCG54_00012410 [Colletotrichum gloeosporioides]|uniref:Uncharacterized protein n=2 Tax=Colletotrichum gloeosporioides TaxID=474922 RepID=T0L5W9_COLGC|nr:uncharacterized protein GCG54_00012410 [Colletotrichum gloeosporioides]EQB43680.1 hypothetical protein CGLO_17639 [Colletotrichum gloeosporioides Cg-14]KAF3802164.1 hypothetical protein GCG54_00012410 [Colletotrichum gloeosporioides]
MQFNSIIATVATAAAFWASMAETKCIQGPKRAGNSCIPDNKGLLTCGPGNDGNVLICNDQLKWKVHKNCPSGGCFGCECRN